MAVALEVVVGLGVPVNATVGVDELPEGEAGLVLWGPHETAKTVISRINKTKNPKRFIKSLPAMDEPGRNYSNKREKEYPLQV